MTSRTVFLLALAVACGLTGSARAEGLLDGNQLLDLCTRPVSYGRCVAYILGVVDAAWIAGRWRSGVGGEAILGSARWCSPPPGLNGQLAAAVVIPYLQRNPRDRHFAASALIADALQNTWPCPAAMPAR
jgi:hypothetical protein